MNLAPQVYHMMLDTPYFMPDDAWLGIVFEKLSVSLRDTHRHYAGITSSRKELRLLQHAQSGQLFQKQVVVVVLDYAYENDDVHSKIIQLWFAMKSQQGRQKFNSELYMLPQFLVVVVMSVVVLSLCFRRLSQPMYRYFLRFMAS